MNVTFLMQFDNCDDAYVEYVKRTGSKQAMAFGVFQDWWRGLRGLAPRTREERQQDLVDRAIVPPDYFKSRLISKPGMDEAHPESHPRNRFTKMMVTNRAPEAPRPESRRSKMYHQHLRRKAAAEAREKERQIAPAQYTPNGARAGKDAVIEHEANRLLGKAGYFRKGTPNPDAEAGRARKAQEREAALLAIRDANLSDAQKIACVLALFGKES